MKSENPEWSEIRFLLESIQKTYGHDFRDYAESSIKRRIDSWLSSSPFQTLSQAQKAIENDSNVFAGFLQGITVNVSEMFRDPSFFLALRKIVVPILKTHPHVKIWHAGCASGEEVYSMAIILDEEGFRDRYMIYGTDIDEAILAKAREGIYNADDMRKFTENYQKSGGRSDFSNYYTARYDWAMLHAHLRRNIIFTSHSLAVDEEFGEMNLILCRNVLIYFQQSLKDRALALFDRSLEPGGILCLGSKESLDERKISSKYLELQRGTRIYQKRYEGSAV